MLRLLLHHRVLREGRRRLSGLPRYCRCMRRILWLRLRRWLLRRSHRLRVHRARWLHESGIEAALLRLLLLLLWLHRTACEWHRLKQRQWLLLWLLLRHKRGVALRLIEECMHRQRGRICRVSRAIAEGSQLRRAIHIQSSQSRRCRPHHRHWLELVRRSACIFSPLVPPTVSLVLHGSPTVDRGRGAAQPLVSSLHRLLLSAWISSVSRGRRGLRRPRRRPYSRDSRMHQQNAWWPCALQPASTTIIITIEAFSIKYQGDIQLKN